MKKGKQIRTFREIYVSKNVLEKQEFEIIIGRLCMKSLGTIRLWAYGCRNPSALCKKLIAEELNIPENELFPKKKIVNEEAL